ncbi:MAG: glycosyl transferase family 28 [bacterium]|nr:glycosyl transferase family 28 [bacterium]
MILVTVGTQGPFERMIETIDAWAGESRRGDVFAQVGATSQEPRHLEWVESLDPDEFTSRLAEAEAVIAHAGMGTILTALMLEKPILVMPRRAELGEQRNDHQLATLEKLAELGAVTPAWDEHELRARLDEIDGLVAAAAIKPHASTELLERVRSFLETGR